ncbi:MAG TPA: HAD family phosphatase [Candidatus Saccharimonadaceae bacterium]|nr:HAD family phosphatase [Candidatus Saccharimonadaceae bacterium]
MTNIRAIIFDCFGVLTNDGWRDLRHTYGTTPERLEKFSYLDRAVNDGRMKHDEFVREIAAITGLSASGVNKLFDERRNNEELFAYIRDALAPHYKIAMLSNAAANWLDEFFTPAQIALFNPIVLSYAVGVIKPDRAIYEITLQKLGEKPENCVFIDDVPAYCHAAEALGIHAILYKDFTQMKRQLAAVLH